MAEPPQIRSQLRFLLGSEPIELREIDPTQTVLEYLRLDRRLVGSKEGCAEGDCGACTVLVGRPVAGGTLHYQAVNACICFLATLDGCQLIAVEHLRPSDGGLHPVQQALVECHGSQCGFCTPGFVMALAALWLNADDASEVEIETALQGNLCRCTGYKPIVAAGQRMFALGRRGDDPLYLAASAMAEQLRGLVGGELASARLQLGLGDRRFIAPADLTDLSQVLIEQPQARIVAGATDVGLWVTKGLQLIETVVWLGRIAELRNIDAWLGNDEPDGENTPPGGRQLKGLRIGAMVSYSQAWPVLVASFPDLGELFHRIGGAQVRNMGTIGGNIANGSPIGDMPPALIALGARLILRHGREQRELALEDYFIEYGRQDRQRGEFIEAVIVPFAPERSHLRVYKISKRREEDISTLLAAIRVDRNEAGDISRARIAYGGMAGTPKRASNAEAALLGKPWSAASFEQAARAVQLDYSPLSDWRASAGYRARVAANLIRRFWLEVGDIEIEARLAPVLPPLPGRQGAATWSTWSNSDGEDGHA